MFEIFIFNPNQKREKINKDRKKNYAKFSKSYKVHVIFILTYFCFLNFGEAWGACFCFFSNKKIWAICIPGFPPSKGLCQRKLRTEISVSIEPSG